MYLPLLVNMDLCCYHERLLKVSNLVQSLLVLCFMVKYQALHFLLSFDVDFAVMAVLIPRQ